MKPHYQAWISSRYGLPQEAQLQCAEATAYLILAFPELKRVRGTVMVEEPYGCLPTRTPHWWCLDPDGEVVDPTGHQYPTRILSYHPVDESRGEPCGKCMICGDLVYQDFKPFCSKKCQEEY